MLSVIYAECYLCWVLFMLSVIYAECIVIDAPQSGLKGLSQTLNKTIKMRYDAQM